ncbi:hypothetical protein GCM10009555_007460 [Acrocarpospora macrocephala]|uniref:Uncharacterized protein n=1 Tax=Acrocarpospora macrocephala TaxID=150177 RepID=A0A5M3WXH7_9ACTN|nr:hypothetical protein [Acrocarpospora macrocephala]GES12952.1 hypothetical protein Amac_065490 [Acrocarpospora macrocephala]
MAVWEIWQGEDRGRDRISVHHDRVEALAGMLALQARSVDGSLYRVDGPPDPLCRTNRDLYSRLVGVGEDMKAAGRTLDEFLRAWWLVSWPMAGLRGLELDVVAAMVTAAAVIDPPARRPVWRTTSYDLAREPASYADWEQVVLSQIADLADFADAGPLDEYAFFGVDVPRPWGVVRATGVRWYNFDPRTYLECGMAGSIGGWDEADGFRKAVPGPVISLTSEPEPGERPLNTLTWADLAELAICGQEYE